MTLLMLPSTNQVMNFGLKYCSCSIKHVHIVSGKCDIVYWLDITTGAKLDLCLKC